ncbi:carbonate dehydratase [Sneathiella sp. P13V-1]|uniref:carbonate dehydratase n=1 Tax=Sneathiella sp. P13V-1 TaxID=2697366 RepID=UPI00187B8960|nr:carbonate dehydratase [Sneathiella sp. P13V-1]MBE7637271.1 carbonate dehydratase [Sneathiella sp. P13V-1]
MKKPTPQELFERNKEWSMNKLTADSEFFSRLSDIQEPNYLWVGCADSRVPANEIVGLEPGELFVHRNVANIVPHSDANCLAVIQYAVEVLKVEHIIVTGHYNCGGVRAALGDQDHGQIDNWLAHIKDVLRDHYDEVTSIEDENDQVNRLVELNVIQQVRNVAKTSIVQNAWRKGQELTIHGWVYSLHDGILKDLEVDMNSIDQIHKAYQINQ